MLEYYKTRPSTAATSVASQNPTDTSNTQTLSEYDKHRKMLLSEDTREGWASELRRYLGTMQRDVAKETDIVQWWQVHCFTSTNHYLLIVNPVG
jgi:hypothetical protein